MTVSSALDHFNTCVIIARLVSDVGPYCLPAGPVDAELAEGHPP